MSCATSPSHNARIGHRWRAVRVALTLVVVAAACLTVAGCGSSGSSGGSDSGGATTTIKMEAYAGSALSWVQYVAQQRGFFARNHLDAKFVTLAGGVNATNALVGGSIDIANVGALNFAPLLAKGQKFTLLVNDLKTYFGLTVSKSMAGESVADVMDHASVIGVPSVGGEAGLLMQYMARAYGRSPSQLKLAADIPGAGLEGGHEDALMTTADTQCVLAAHGYPSAVSFFDPSQAVSSFPASLRPLFGASELGFWSSGSWASEHPQTVREFQRAIKQTIAWATNPANHSTLDQLLHSSPYNLASLSTQQFDGCVAKITKGFTASYTPVDATVWSTVAKTVGIAPGLPPTSKWFAPGLGQ